MKPPAIVILGETSFAVARQVQAALPAAVVYGLAGRTRSAIVTYANLTSGSWENAIALWGLWNEEVRSLCLYKSIKFSQYYLSNSINN